MNGKKTERRGTPVRLDKLISECGVASRSEIAKACRKGLVSVNGTVEKRPQTGVDPDADRVEYCGVPLEYRKYVYVMLNKPDGYVSATEDKDAPCVTELLPKELQNRGLFPSGRLDKHTLGLMLLTDDGPLSHKLLAPKSHVEKSYAFSVAEPLSETEIETLEAGVDIGEEKPTKPCRIEMKTEKAGVITITEGKYHQIKRMMESVGNRIVDLERITFGPLSLDPILGRGEWRFLTEEEIAKLKK